MPAPRAPAMPSPTAPAAPSPSVAPASPRPPASARPRAFPIAATRPSWMRRPSRYAVGPRCAAFRVRTTKPLRVEPEQLRTLEQLAHAAQELHGQLAVDHAMV